MEFLVGGEGGGYKERMGRGGEGRGGERGEDKRRRRGEGGRKGGLKKNLYT